jgi:hypothetical protein
VLFLVGGVGLTGVAVPCGAVGLGRACWRKGIGSSLDVCWLMEWLVACVGAVIRSRGAGGAVAGGAVQGGAGRGEGRTQPRMLPRDRRG